jgi:hypothetical protein
LTRFKGIPPALLTSYQGAEKLDLGPILTRCSDFFEAAPRPPTADATWQLAFRRTLLEAC